MSTRIQGPGSREELVDGGTCIACGHAIDSGGFVGPTRIVPGPCESCGAAQEAGSFRMIRVLARTDHGRTYLAQAGDGRRVALRELLLSKVPDAEQLDAFEREAKLLRQLNHPQIPKYVSSLREGSGAGVRLYLAQEHVEGTTLLERLQNHRFNEAEVRALALQILDVLEYLHGLRPPVIHGDLNPSNLIVREGAPLAVVGFSAARELERVQGKTGTVAFGYHAPEQLSGAAVPASDLYGLGVTMLHLLTRKPPEELADPGQPVSVRKVLSASEELTAFLERLVAPNPSERFASVAEARRALKTGKLERRFSKRAVRLAWLGAGLLGLGVLAGGYELFSPPDTAEVTSASAEVPALLARLRAEGKGALADQLDQRVNAQLAALKASGRPGHVLVGRVVVDGGSARPEDTFTQTELLEGGYFVTTAGDLRRPISFRLHGYEPTVLRPTSWRNTELQDIGEIRLKPVAASLLGNVRGDVALEDPTRGRATVQVFMKGGSVNTTDGRRDAGEKKVAEQQLPPGGELRLSGFSPVAYRLELSAPGHESVSIDRTMDRGDDVDLGTLRLPVLQRVEFTSRSGAAPSRTSTSGEQGQLDLAGTLGSDAVSITQRDGKLWFVSGKFPVAVTDVGTGTVDQFADAQPRSGQAKAPEDVELVPGHVYLIDAGERGRALLRANPR